ncbi:hypothetical protein NYO91_17575, partial [Arhodomonas aquaeolei]|uniref:hypothetical protein n=1 Tax=Arhodomonas aquaeolei TaxID=2369 RepID=UPI002167F4CD
VIAIIDGFREFAEAAALSRRGAVARQVYGHAFLGGIGLAGGLIALACSSAVLVPAVFTLITLVTVGLLRQLVPLNIRIWLRRSLYGVQQEDYRYEPFHSAGEEQEALAMVLRGIVFDMTVTDLQGSVGGTLMLADAYQSGVPGTIAWTEEAVRTPELTFTLTVPEALHGVVRVRIEESSPGQKANPIAKFEHRQGDTDDQNFTIQDRFDAATQGTPLAEKTKVPLEIETRDGQTSISGRVEVSAGATRIVAEVQYFSLRRAWPVANDKFPLRLTRS